MGGEEEVAALVASVGGGGWWVRVWEVKRHLGVRGRSVLGGRIRRGRRWRRRARWWCTVESIARPEERNSRDYLAECCFGLFIL